MRRTSIFVAVATSALLLSGGVAQAHPEPVSDGGTVHHDADSPGEVQHGTNEGHLVLDSSENVDLVGKVELTTIEGAIADVGVKGDYAYLNQWREACPNGGVHVVDISDPANPEKVGFLPANKNSYPGEGAQVINITTKWFSGDVYAHNNEACDSDRPFKGGVSLWNVTDPTAPELLIEGAGDRDRVNPRVEHPSNNANQSHSVFMWDAGSRAYAVLVDNEELADVDIMDISKPAAPVHIGEFDLNARYPQIVDHLGTAESFHHDVVVKQIAGHWYMLVSYWDGGYVILNVDNPANPSYVADSDFPELDSEAAESGLTVKPEGNAHEAEFSKDNDYIVASDEDFNAYKVIPRNVTDGTEFVAVNASGTPPVDQDDGMSGDTVWVGRACPGDPAVPAAPTTPSGSQVALIERGVCDFSVKIAAVEAAGGYEGVIVFNRQLEDGCSGLVVMLADNDIQSVFVDRATGWDLLDIPGYNETACRGGTQPTPNVAIGTIGDEVDMSAIFDGWGYVRLFRNDVNAGDGSNKLQELDTFAIPEAHDPAYAEGYGDLSVHEVAMSPTVNELAYFSYYAAGFKVMQIQDDELVETGHFADEGGNNFWGVQVWHKDGKEYVLASDRDYGLYIFEYTGPGSPNV